MKAIFVVVAVLGTLALAGPAHAAVWDFSWLSTAMFGPGRDGSPPVDTRLTGATTATITPDATSNDLTIDFATPFGPGSVFVNQDHSALGGVPMVFCRDCPPSVGAGTSIGQYSFTGSFTNPDRFTLAMSSGGSGPAGIQRFSGTGTRQPVSASEPAVMLVIGGALAGAAWARRAIRS